ncbi:hypothetical protein PIROE2DRAFT_8040 [Piromyces sp. E2]|nr:hypothetical protein PIROE2DRAFT_8040 [Piromyces sp. E2]|eukprot:OUM65060.1 hypothetical protein PIROE2DRAFT_8040 [Piromyces sp. E2]
MLKKHRRNSFIDQKHQRYIDFPTIARYLTPTTDLGKCCESGITAQKICDLRRKSRCFGNRFCCT